MKKKHWIFKIYEENPSKPSSLFNFKWTKRYLTEKSANQAFKDWQEGRGNLAHVCKKELGWLGKVYHQ